jgi:hypothetical protein
LGVVLIIIGRIHGGKFGVAADTKARRRACGNRR